jgi:hypothetical protein
MFFVEGNVQQAMQKMPMEYVTYMNAESDAYAF